MSLRITSSDWVHKINATIKDTTSLSDALEEDITDFAPLVQLFDMHLGIAHD